MSFDISNGNNKLTSKNAFKQRKKYNEVSYPDTENKSTLLEPRNINLFFNKSFYGRINGVSNSVTAGEEIKGTIDQASSIGNEKKYLKVFPQDRTKFAMNFVVDAFLDLSNYYNNACSTLSTLSRNGILSSIKPEKAWTSNQQLLSDHQQIIYERFIFGYMNKQFNNKITTIDNFVDVFQEFLFQIAEDMPVTYTGFNTSHFCSPHSSGIILDTAVDDETDDFVKTNKYLNSVNFTFFELAAVRYGFFIDKYVPWRLVADLSSKTMISYMKKYNLETYNDVFKKQYIETYKADILKLRNFVFDAYNKFVDSYPGYVMITACDDGYRQQNLTRKKIDQKDFLAKYGINYWIKLYCFLRARETNIDYSQKQLEVFITDAVQKYNSSGLDASMLYINNLFNGFKYGLTDKNFLTKKFQDDNVVDEQHISKQNEIFLR
jgi:hypothetical protein